jgi:hypothetical protein
VTEAEFLDLLNRPEGDTLDFKRQLHDLSSPEGEGEFIKDCIAMANTPRESSGFIILAAR